MKAVKVALFGENINNTPGEGAVVKITDVYRHNPYGDNPEPSLGTRPSARLLVS